VYSERLFAFAARVLIGEMTDVSRNSRNPPVLGGGNSVGLSGNWAPYLSSPKRASESSNGAFRPIYRSIIALHPTNPKGYFYYGEYLLKSGRQDEAVEQLTQACCLSGRNALYLSTLGAALAASGKNDAGSDACGRKEARFPPSCNGHCGQ